MEEKMDRAHIGTYCTACRQACIHWLQVGAANVRRLVMNTWECEGGCKPPTGFSYVGPQPM